MTVVDPGVPFGRRLQILRERSGKSRTVLAALVGKSSEWLKAIEKGRLLPPRLPMMLALAQALGLDDLSELTGDERLRTVGLGKAAHEQLSDVATALATYPVRGGDVAPDVAGLRARVAQTWELWHGTHRHRTATAALLPTLLHDARVTVRATEGQERRDALTQLAQVNHLTQLYLSYQPRADLVMLTGDRAMNAAQDADDPAAMAAAAWYLNHVYRDANDAAEARVGLAYDTAALLDPAGSVEHRSLYGLLHLAIALSHAKLGSEGDAFRAWDEADRAASSLPAGWSHPWLVFGRGIVNGYVVDILCDLAKPGEAARQGDNLNLDAIPSATRRSRHITQIARAFYLQQEPVAAVALLRRAEAEAVDTAAYDPFTRATVAELAEHGGTTVRDDARELSHRLGLPAA